MNGYGGGGNGGGQQRGPSPMLPSQLHQQHQQSNNGYGRGYIPNPSVSPAYANRHLFVGNIPFNCQWQDLKDLFRAAGQILRADVSLGPDGRSRGFGTVLFATQEDARNAVNMFNGYEFQGRVLKVHFDKFTVGGGNGQPGASGLQQQHEQYGMGHMINNNNNNGISNLYGLSFAGPGQLFGQNQHQHQQGILQNLAGAQYRHDYPEVFRNDYNDDTGSVPGTPIQETSLAHYADPPMTPGFASPVPQQFPRQNSGSHRSEVAPIGTGAPHHHPDQHGEVHHSNGNSNGPPAPLSPLSIPTRTMGMNMGMGMNSPGMFSPTMSPHQGMPMMTPSSMFTVRLFF